MTAKNRTSSRNKKPGVYVDQTAAAKESHTMFVKQERARKFAALRLSQNKGAAAAAAAAAAANPLLPLAPVVAAAVAAVSKKGKAANDSAEAEEGDEEEQDASATAADEDEPAAAAADVDADGALSSTTADGFTVAFQPFVSSDSSTIAATTESSLKDEKVLGVALYEWLLLRQDWDCHTLWERFLRDWDLITETERPPGTNRPINLHAYLTFLRGTNNKATVRKDVRLVRETLLAERLAHVEAHPEDPRARPNLEALNGTLLAYYLKIKNLIPYESEAQQKRKEAKRKRMEAARKATEQGEGEEGDNKEAEAGAEGDTDADAVVEVKPVQHKKKKGKFVHPSAKAATAASPAPPTGGSLRMGQANSFAALLDCD